LIDDRIDGDGGLAGLPVTDDQFTLPAANGNHGVDGLDARLQGFAHRLTCIHPRCRDFYAGRERRFDRALSVDRLPNRVDHTTEQCFANWNLRNTSRALDRIAFLDPHVIAHEHGADVVFFKVQRDPVESAGEFEHFTSHGAVEAIDLGNPVSDLNDRAGLLDIDLFVEAFDFLFDNRTDFFCLDLHGYSLVNRFCIACNRPRTVLSTTVLPRWICTPAIWRASV
jgi:hypothetical protein